MVTEMMHIKFFRNLFMDVKKQEKTKHVFEGAVFVSEKKTS
jgi:hypothetical protein